MMDPVLQRQLREFSEGGRVPKNSAGQIAQAANRRAKLRSAVAALGASVGAVAIAASTFTIVSQSSDSSDRLPRDGAVASEPGESDLTPLPDDKFDDRLECDGQMSHISVSFVGEPEASPTVQAAASIYLKAGEQVVMFEKDEREASFGVKDEDGKLRVAGTVIRFSTGWLVDSAAVCED
jgi:hypothetical protein